MTIYSIIIVLLFVAVFIEDQNLKKRQLRGHNINRVQGLYLILVAFITIVSAIRYDVGADCLGYYEDYDNLKDGIVLGLQDYEPGFMMLNKLLGLFFVNPQCIIVTTSLIINILIAVEIQKRSKYPLLSLFCYVTFFFYFISMNVIRQYISIAIVFGATGFLFNNNKKGIVYYSIAMLLAASFHVSGLIGFLGLLAYWVKQNKVFKISIVIFSVFLYLSVGSISSFIISYVPVYEFYSDYGREGGSDSSVFILFVILLISWLFENKLSKNIEHYNFYQNCLVLGVFLNILANINIMYARMGMYFTINLTLFIPAVIAAINIKNRSLVRFVIMVIAVAYCFWNLSNNNGRVLPYKTIMGISQFFSI